MTTSSMREPSSSPAGTLFIEKASASWPLIMQSGVGLACTVGVPVEEFLRDELGVSGAMIQRIDAVLLDGQPVDDIALAKIPDGARLAFAAGLPGIAGLAMKRGSAVRALRGGISHVPSSVGEPGPGRITLLLYSLALDMLGASFLARGVEASIGQIRRYAQFAPDDMCIFSGCGSTAPPESAPVSSFLKRTTLESDVRIILKAGVAPAFLESDEN